MRILFAAASLLVLIAHPFVVPHAEAALFLSQTENGLPDYMTEAEVWKLTMKKHAIVERDRGDVILEGNGGYAYSKIRPPFRH